MVKAVVGANWGDEEKVRLQICWLSRQISSLDSREARMQVIQLSMIMENLHYIHFHQEYFTVIQPVLSEMV